MATPRNKRKLATASEVTQGSARNGQSQDKFVPGMTEEYINWMSEELEARVTEKLFQESIRRESFILGVLSKLDDFLLIPQVRTWSGTVPGTSRNNNSEKQEATGDRSLNDPYPEVELSVPQASTSADSDRDETYHLVTGVQEGILYCSHATSSRKQQKTRSTSQPQMRRENTLATFEADQTLLTLQQLATNSNSANFKNNISRISKLPKTLTMTMPTFDGKSENFELFEDLFQTSLKIHNQLTEEDKIN